MAHEVLMPKLSSTMTDGTITVWLKNEGDSVEIGEAIFEVMTDKIAIEVEAYEEGVLLKRYIDDGESAPVNSIIAYIGEVGEQVPATAPAMGIVAEDISATEGQVKSEVGDKQSTETVTATNSQNFGGKIRATPAARKAAREKGIDLQTVDGSGPRGRIQAADIANYKKMIPEPVKKGEQSAAAQLLPWSGMRKAIADKMQLSHSTIPHVTMNAEVNMTSVVELREQLLPMIEEQTGERLSYLEIIIKATMVALKSYPQFNAHGLTEGIKLFDDIHMGVAVAVPDGLVVPVIKKANAMGLVDLTKSVKELTGKARENKLEPVEMSGGTFTISSLGRSKVKEFTPIINAPEAAILGVGGMFEKLSVDVYNNMEKIEHIPIVNLCLSFDHRIADGAPAAAFLSKIVEILENPMSLLL